MTNGDYSRYSLYDFLEDEHFIRWVILPNAESDAFWKSVALQHPEKAGLISQASSIIRAYKLQDSFTNENNKEAVWKRIASTIESQQQVQSKIISISFYRKMAAAIVLLIVSGAVFLLLSRKEQIITTAYGEVKTITLPDHSKVTLNGNSSLRYTSSWNSSSAREVWLDGEAYFDVVHINKDITHVTPGERFIVHSAEVNLQVLGTTFNVEHRRDQTDITLITGKVKVEANCDTSAPNAVILTPGEHVQYVKTKLVEKKRVEKLKTITAWMNHEFIFSNPLLQDILQSLMDDYGYQVQVDKELLPLLIEGDINVSSVDELLSTAGVALGLRIEKSGQRIVITSK